MEERAHPLIISEDGAAPHPPRNVTPRPAFARSPSDRPAVGRGTYPGASTMEVSADARPAFGLGLTARGGPSRGDHPSHVEPRAAIRRPGVAVPRRRLGRPGAGIESRGSPAGAPSAAAKADDSGPAPAPGRMFVVGRVLDPRGNPVPGAAVMVQAKDETPRRAPYMSLGKPIRLGDARGTARAGSGSMRPERPRATRPIHRHRDRARLRRRLGHARPRRRSARRRHSAPAGAGDPRAAVRRAGTARPGCQGLGPVHRQ